MLENNLAINFNNSKIKSTLELYITSNCKQNRIKVNSKVTNHNQGFCNNHLAEDKSYLPMLLLNETELINYRSNEKQTRTDLPQSPNIGPAPAARASLPSSV